MKLKLKRDPKLIKHFCSKLRPLSPPKASTRNSLRTLCILQINSILWSFIIFQSDVESYENEEETITPIHSPETPSNCAGTSTVAHGDILAITPGTSRSSSLLLQFRVNDRK